MSNVSTFCRVCEPACGLIARVEDGEITSLRPDRDHPISKGFACHKGIASLDIHLDPDRVDRPQRRTADGFEDASWDEAIGDIAARLRRILDEDGPEAITAYVGNPTAFNTFVGPAIGSLLGQLGIRKTFSSGTQDCSNKFAGSEAVFGTSTCHPVPDIEHTDHLLIFGENPRVSHMSFISLPDPLGEIKRAVKRGAVVRHVNPRRIEEKEAGAGEVIQLRPDTDVYLMAALLDAIFAEGLADAAALADHGTRVEELRAFVSRYPAERVAEVVGLSAEQIRSLAREFASADRASVHMSTGTNMGRQGTLAYWLLQMLSFVTGNLDREGGNLYSLGFYAAAKAGRTKPEKHFFDGPHGRMRRIRGSWPGNLMADELRKSEPKIRALFVIAGNPVLSVGGEEALREAIEGVELVVSLDLYRNATGELADWVLPCADGLERADLNIAGLGLQARPYVQWSDALVPPRHERKEEWWILARLEQALGLKSVLDAGPKPELTGRLAHMMSTRGIDFQEAVATPGGVPLEPLTPGRFFSDWIQTDDQRVDCYPPVFETEDALARCATIFEELEAEGPEVLKLISLRTPYMHNSWYQNLEKLKRPGRLENPLHIHSLDAEARGLTDGDRVLCRNTWGEIEAPIHIDDTLRPGVVAMTHGWGNRATPGMSVAERHPGVNANRLLPSGPGSYEPLSNQAFMTGIPLVVERA
ncbi:MAG: molybdopterin-dependent oxidoreductase [Deltaproteobacteria bacterium]|nr:molybdopterin-dependent oxidoreductase [Deltaproteobacteria bacterium]MBW2394775.1 molybdopterin-dependent oxidoreductase [Deltaproteobacteria bacterium]